MRQQQCCWHLDSLTCNYVCLIHCEAKPHTSQLKFQSTTHDSKFLPHSALPIPSMLVLYILGSGISSFGHWSFGEQTPVGESALFCPSFSGPPILVCYGRDQLLSAQWKCQLPLCNYFWSNSLGMLDAFPGIFPLRYFTTSYINSFDLGGICIKFNFGKCGTCWKEESLFNGI